MNATESTARPASPTPGPRHFRNADRPDSGLAPCRYMIENCPSRWNPTRRNDDGTIGDWENDAAHYGAIAITTCGSALYPSEANARLIAAAPALLAALRDIAANDMDRHCMAMAARSAIALAEGGAS